MRALWDPVVKEIEKRLIFWRNCYVSLGGKVVLINSVLGSISIFFMSFFKMLIYMWKKIVRKQMNLLWGGLAGETKICWVMWN